MCMFVSDWQDSKARLPMLSTEAGMVTLVIEVLSKALPVISVTV